MNKEFKVLEDGNMEVTDENGNITVRYCGNSIQSELLSENKTELIENKLKDAEKKLNEDVKVTKLSKRMLIFQPIIFTVGTLGAAVIGGLVNPGNVLVGAIYHAVKIGLFSLPITVPAAIYWTIVGTVYKKKVKNDEAKITSINIIKNNYEKENKRIKESDYQRRGFYPNHTFSLEQDTEKINEALDNQINMVYDSNKSYSPKLTMKRK